jgi:hypothetical protein
LVFESGDSLHVRMKVRYTDFELARAKVKIFEIEDPNAPKKEPTPAPRKP